MKTFFKTNLIGIFAVLLAVGTMSFTMLRVDEPDLKWYEVGPTGTIEDETSPPSGTCEVDYHANICKILLDTENPIPPTVSDANFYGYTRGIAGVRTP